MLMMALWLKPYPLLWLSEVQRRGMAQNCETHLHESSRIVHLFTQKEKSYRSCTPSANLVEVNWVLRKVLRSLRKLISNTGLVPEHFVEVGKTWLKFRGRPCQGFLRKFSCEMFGGPIGAPAQSSHTARAPAVEISETESYLRCQWSFSIVCLILLAF